jgi:hypothetical protein
MPSVAVTSPMMALYEESLFAIGSAFERARPWVERLPPLTREGTAAKLGVIPGEPPSGRAFGASKDRLRGEGRESRRR